MLRTMTFPLTPNSAGLCSIFIPPVTTEREGLAVTMLQHWRARDVTPWRRQVPDRDIR
jgi:hypothetical protein